MQNLKIRRYAENNKVRLWQIAERIGISEPTMTRKLRRELSDEETEKIIQIINDIVNERQEA